MKAKITLIPFIISIAAVLLIMTSFFLPFASSAPDTRDLLNSAPDEMFIQEIEMTNQDATDLSLVEYFRVYMYMAESGRSVTVSIIAIVMISVLALFSLLTALFVCLKKAVPIIVFTLLNASVFSLLCWDFKDRGIVENSTYSYGITYQLFYVALIILLACAIWLLVIKIMSEKKTRDLSVSNNDKSITGN